MRMAGGRVCSPGLCRWDVRPETQDRSEHLWSLFAKLRVETPWWGDITFRIYVPKGKVLAPLAAMDAISQAALATVCGNRDTVLKELRREVVRQKGGLQTLQEPQDHLVHVHRVLLDCHRTALGMLESLSQDLDGVEREEDMCPWRALAHAQNALEDIMDALTE